MKQVLLITGNLAALKSTLAKRLSNDLNVVCLNKDDMKEVLGDTIGFSNREENLKLSKATFGMMIKLMLDILKVHDLVVLESNFKSNEIQYLNEVVSSHDIRQSIVFFTGEVGVLYERYVRRQPERHHVHTSTGLISFENFKMSMAPFDLALYGNRSFMYDTTVMNDEKYQELLKKIKELLNDQS
jgi:predicted kinase